MTVTTIPLLPGMMNVSSEENHKKIAALLEATSKYLEPIKYAESVEEQSVYMAICKDQHMNVRSYVGTL
ncbi:MAG: hypothetical protein JJE09_15645 [Bacteroidia bacterium]|nr:hypothetical protein [Bacteroidia bacterium]